jgi:hypothetical protein
MLSLKNHFNISTNLDFFQEITPYLYKIKYFTLNVSLNNESQKINEFIIKKIFYAKFHVLKQENILNFYD